MHDENKPSDLQNETSHCNKEQKKDDVDKSLDSLSAVTNGLSKLTTDFSNENESIEDDDQIITDQDSLCSSAVTNGMETSCFMQPDKPPRMQSKKDTENLNATSDSNSGERLDSTGVDVLEFLRMTLRNSHKDRAILLRFEHEMMEFINNKMVDYMKFSAMTSYHRMLLHRVAAYFGMDHNVDETGKCVIVNKIKETKIPEFRFAEYISDCNLIQNTDDLRRRSILKRSNQSKSFDHGQSNRNDWKDNRQRSLEEREENYEKIRARIFNAEASSGKLSSVAITTTTQLSNGSVTPSCTKTSPPTTRPRPTITVLPRSSSATCLTDSTTSQTSPSLNNTKTSCGQKTANQRTPATASERKTTPLSATANGYETNSTTPPNVATKNDGYSPREQRIPTYNDYPYNGAPPPVSVEHQQFPPRYHGNAPASNGMYPPYNDYHMYPLPPPPSGMILPPSVQHPMHSNNQPPYHQTAVYQHSNGSHSHSDTKQNGVYLKHPEHPPSNNGGGYKTYMHQHTNHAQQQIYPVYTQPSNRTNNLQREVPLMYLPATNNHAPSYCVYSQFHTSPQNPQLGMQDISNGRSTSRRDY